MLTRPAWLLRLEEAGLLTAVVLLYIHFHFSWLLFAVLFLAPDLFMLGYLANPRVGAALYNLGHFLLLPLCLFAVAYGGHRPLVMGVAIISGAPIPLFPLLGFGVDNRK